MRQNAFPFGEGGLAKQGRMRAILEQNHITEDNNQFVFAEVQYNLAVKHPFMDEAYWGR
jgi:hypothetical protein